MRTGREVWSKKTNQSLHSVAFSPDGRTLACGDCNGSVGFHDVASGRSKESLRVHHSAIRQVEFHPRNGNIFSAGFDGSWWATPIPTGDE